MSKHKDRPKPKAAPRFWADIRNNGGVMTWGVECDEPSLTFDGRYVLLVPGKSFAQAGAMAERIANALSGRRALR